MKSLASTRIVLGFLVLFSFTPIWASTQDLNVGIRQNDFKHVVVMGYEPWFGFSAQYDWSRVPGPAGTSILPLSSTTGYERVLSIVDDFKETQTFRVNGYDSADVNIIRKH